MKKIFCLLVLPPIYSIIIGVYKYIKSYNYWDFVIGFLGILSCLIPMDDSIYTYENFLYYKNLSAIEFIKLELPFYFYLIYFFNKLGVSFHQILLIINFIILFIWFFIFKSMTFKNNAIVIISILMLYIRVLLDITRYTMANTLFLFFFVNNLKKNKISNILLLILILKIHNALLIPIIIFYLSIILKKLKLDLYMLGLIFSTIMVIKFFFIKILYIFQKIIGVYSSTVAQRVNYYILNNTYKNILNDNINKGKMLILILSIVVSLIIIIKSNFKRNKKLKFIRINLILFLAVLLLFSDNFVIFERYSYTYLSIFIIYLALILKKECYKKMIIVKIFILCILVMNIYNNTIYFRKFYIKKNAVTLNKNYSGTKNLTKIFYLPTSYLLIKDNFKNEWFEKWRNNE